MGTEERRALAAEILKDPAETPLLVQRCVLSVLDEKYVKGVDDLARFTGAVDICLARFEKNGLVKKDSLQLTADGMASQNEKRRLPDKSEKSMAWSRLTRKLQLQEKAGGS